MREAFERRYARAGGRLDSDDQTAYAMALEFSLLREPHHRRAAGRRLAALVRENGYRIGTGFLGTPLVCDALGSAAEYEVAYRLLLQHDCPSWLYPVTMGATTIWERWDSVRPDGSITPSQMTSLNHYAFGAIADWLHRSVAGLAPAAPGYRRIAIHPVPGGGLTFARARHRTPYGMASVEWRLLDGGAPGHRHGAMQLRGRGDPSGRGSVRGRLRSPPMDGSRAGNLGVADNLAACGG